MPGKTWMLFVVRKTTCLFLPTKKPGLSGVLWLHGARRMGFGGTCWFKGSLFDFGDDFGGFLKWEGRTTVFNKNVLMDIFFWCSLTGEAGRFDSHFFCGNFQLVEGWGSSLAWSLGFLFPGILEAEQDNLIQDNLAEHSTYFHLEAQ